MNKLQMGIVISNLEATVEDQRQRLVHYENTIDGQFETIKSQEKSIEQLKSEILDLKGV